MGRVRSAGKAREEGVPALGASRLCCPWKVAESMAYSDSTEAQGSVALYWRREAPWGVPVPAVRLRAKTRGAAEPLSRSTRTDVAG